MLRSEWGKVLIATDVITNSFFHWVHKPEDGVPATPVTGGKPVPLAEEALMRRTMALVQNLVYAGNSNIFSNNEKHSMGRDCRSIAPGWCT